ASSTDESRRQRAAARLLLGDENSTVHLTLQDPRHGTRDVELQRRSTPSSARTSPVVQEFEGGKIGYIDLDRLSPSEADEAFKKVADRNTLILDLRGYPRGTSNQVIDFVNSQHRKKSLLVGFRMVDGDGSTSQVSLQTELPDRSSTKYHGRVIVLIDETT